ncbi:MAG: hypothetical protein HY721_02565 [Planctomycetes bacterium]|nr:hypothetical protein [Planctomycetota bacterium]
MPIHDWSRVSDRAFHHFHIFWFSRLSDALNQGLLPPGYYALVEPVAGEAIPDVLTLEAQAGSTTEVSSSGSLQSEDAAAGSLALLKPPAVIQDLGPSYTQLARHVLVRSEVEGDRVVAAIELVSRGNKVGRSKVDQFVSKSVGYLESGIHLAILDVQVPTSLVQAGFHALICEAMGQDPPEEPQGHDRQVVSYQVRASGYPRAYVAQLRVGSALPELPLFILPDRFLSLPLEATYTAAYGSLARKFREALEAP